MNIVINNGNTIVTNNGYNISGSNIVSIIDGEISDPDIVTINISEINISGSNINITNHSDPALRCSAPMHKDMVTHCEAQDLETCAS